MTDLDRILSGMKAQPLDPRLDGIDAAVLAGLARRAHAPVSAGAMALVAMLSLAVGVAGSLVPAATGRADAALPLGTPIALAPSTLLGPGE